MADDSPLDREIAEYHESSCSFEGWLLAGGLLCFACLLLVGFVWLLREHARYRAQHDTAPSYTAAEKQAEWDTRLAKQVAAATQFLAQLTYTPQGQIICTGSEEYRGALCNARVHELDVPLVFRCGTTTCIMEDPPAVR